MFPLTVNGKTYQGSDFITQGYESAIRNFVEDCNSHFSGSLYSNGYSHHSCAYFAGSYTASVGAATLNGCQGGDRLQVGSQVAIASLTTNKKAFGVITASTVVSGESGNIVKNFTIQVSSIYAPAGEETGWLILPYGFPEALEGTLTQSRGGTGVTTSEAARPILGNPLPSQAKKTIFEDFLGISQRVSSIPALTDGQEPFGLYCGAAGAGQIDFRIPSDLASEVDGNTAGVAVFTVATNGDIAFVALNNAPIAFPGVGSRLTFRFKLIGVSTSNYTSVRAGFCDHAGIPFLPSNYTAPWGLTVDLNFDRFRVARDMGGLNYNMPIPGEPATVQNSVWYKVEIRTVGGNAVNAKIWREDSSVDTPPQFFSTNLTANNSNLVVPFFKVGKISGTQPVRVLLDYIHWYLPGTR